jgi:hypothetical protein
MVSVPNLEYCTNRKKGDVMQKSKKRVQFENKMLRELVTDLFWEYDRMSSSGQKTLDNLAKLIGVPTEAEIEGVVKNGK